ncbi:hypothetical protein AURDEDRAFT_184814 [Auricularia subglabra TFB-10046 SS5]|nr:hypothetical protein AURDEDRAFT_184814 [Auricularia subglabra TFB-10046 SS5]
MLPPTASRWFVLAILLPILNAADIIWMYFYVWTGTHPNPRTIINSGDGRWSAFQTGMNFFGFILSTFNAVAWFLVYRSGLIFTTPARSTPRPPASPREKTLTPASTFLSRRSTQKPKNSQKAIAWMLSPLAIATILAPFVTPFAALPLAQEWAWNHRCDGWPIEIVLKGQSTPGVQSTATFMQHHALLYIFALYNQRSFAYVPSSAASASPPRVRNITYDLAYSTFTSICSEPCVSGTMDQDIQGISRLTFVVHSSPGNRTSTLRAVDKGWQAPSEAPSVILRDETDGFEAMRTVVTKRGDCAALKVCVAELGEPEMLVPVGMLLVFMEKWAAGSTCGKK